MHVEAESKGAQQAVHHRIRECGGPGPPPQQHQRRSLRRRKTLCSEEFEMEWNRIQKDATKKEARTALAAVTAAVALADLTIRSKLKARRHAAESRVLVDATTAAPASAGVHGEEKELGTSVGSRNGMEQGMERKREPHGPEPSLTRPPWTGWTATASGALQLDETSWHTRQLALWSQPECWGTAAEL